MFPIGYRFNPYDDELILEYLLKKVNGEQLPFEVIVDCDVYGDKPPWKILRERRINKLYAFTKLKKASPSRYSRTTPHGKWHSNTGKNSAVAIRERSGTNQLIGYRNQLTFQPNMKGEGAVASSNNGGGNWIMHQFSLAGSSLSPKNKFPEYVLCVVYQNKTCKSKSEAVQEGVRPTLDAPTTSNLNQEYHDQFLGTHSQEYHDQFLGTNSLPIPTTTSSLRNDFTSSEFAPLKLPNDQYLISDTESTLRDDFIPWQSAATVQLPNQYQISATNSVPIPTTTAILHYGFIPWQSATVQLLNQYQISATNSVPIDLTTAPFHNDFIPLQSSAQLPSTNVSDSNDQPNGFQSFDPEYFEHRVDQLYLQTLNPNRLPSEYE